MSCWNKQPCLAREDGAFSKLQVFPSPTQSTVLATTTALWPGYTARSGQGPQLSSSHSDSPFLLHRPVLICFLFAVINSTTKRSLGRRGFMSSYSCCPSSWEVRTGTRGRYQEAGTEAQATKECSLLTGLLCLLSYTPRAMCPGLASPIVNWALPH